MAWRKRIIRRAAEWYGVNGRHFDTYRFIDVVYYNLEGLKANRPYYIYGAEGAVVGGSGSSDLNFITKIINGTLKAGSPRTSPEEIKRLTLKAREEMLKGNHKWNIPEYNERDEWYNTPIYE